RSRDLPDLLHAERPHLRVLALKTEAIERDAGQMSLRPLSEHGHARHVVRTRLEVPELLAFSAASLVAGPGSSDPPAVDQQLLGGSLGEEHRASFLGLLGEPATEPRKRRDVIAVVLHRRRRRDAKRAL